MMGFDDFPAHRQPQAQAHVAGRIERRGSLLSGFRSKPGSIVLDFDLQARDAIAFGVRVETDADSGIAGIGLQGVQDDFGEGVFERGAISGHGDRLLLLAFELGGLGGLVFAGLLVGFLDQWRERERLLGNECVAGEEAHLVDQPGHALDAIRQRGVE
ncbi:MAG: hypothetical protein ABSA69_08965 [Verrucomicrobiota bacterium]